MQLTTPGTGERGQQWEGASSQALGFTLGVGGRREACDFQSDSSRGCICRACSPVERTQLKMIKGHLRERTASVTGPPTAAKGLRCLPRDPLLWALGEEQTALPIPGTALPSPQPWPSLLGAQVIRGENRGAPVTASCGPCRTLSPSRQPLSQAPQVLPWGGQAWEPECVPSPERGDTCPQVALILLLLLWPFHR